MRICTDLGLKDVQDYAQKLKKAEKARELKQQVNLTSEHFKVILIICQREKYPPANI